MHLLSDFGADPIERIRMFIEDSAINHSSNEQPISTFYKLIIQYPFMILSFEEFQRRVLSVLVFVNTPHGNIPLRVTLQLKIDDQIMGGFELISIQKEELTHPIMDI